MSQSISFNQSLGPYLIGQAPVKLTATASSWLPVSYSTSGPCHMATGKLVLTGVGVCTVTASQAGNGQYAAAQSVTRHAVIEYGVASLTPKSHSWFKHGSTIEVSFVLTNSSGKPISSPAASMFAKAGGLQAVFSGPGGTSQVASCSWNGNRFECLIHAPKTVKTGTANPYQITVRENVGAGLITAPPIGQTQNPVTIYFT